MSDGLPLKIGGRSLLRRGDAAPVREDSPPEREQRSFIKVSVSGREPTLLVHGGGADTGEGEGGVQTLCVTRVSEGPSVLYQLRTNLTEQKTEESET